MFQDSEVFHLDKIKIYNADRTACIMLPRVRDVEVGAEEESKTITMASGRTVKDILGYRSKVTAVWDWIPVETVTRLLQMLRGGDFLWVEYPSPTGTASGYFEIEYPSLNVFCYRAGEPVWHNMTLSMTAQEVTR